MFHVSQSSLHRRARARLVCDIAVPLPPAPQPIAGAIPGTSSRDPPAAPRAARARRAHRARRARRAMQPPLRCPPAPPTHLALSGLVAGATAAAAGLLLGRLSRPRPRGPPREPCPACNGAGYVDCFCRRWTAARAHARPGPACTTCRGSLRTRCPRCRGGGTAVPALVPIPVRVREAADRFLGVFAAAAFVRPVLNGARLRMLGAGAFVSKGRAAVPRRRYGGASRRLV